MDKEYGKIIAQNLKRIAYDNDRTQADICRDLKLSDSTVSSWFNGTRVPRMDKIDLLAHYFNCTRADIMEPHKEDHSNLDEYNETIFSPEVLETARMLSMLKRDDLIEIRGEIKGILKSYSGHYSSETYETMYKTTWKKM